VVLEGEEGVILWLLRLRCLLLLQKWLLLGSLRGLCGLLSCLPCGSRGLVFLKKGAQEISGSGGSPRGGGGRCGILLIDAQASEELVRVSSIL